MSQSDARCVKLPDQEVVYSDAHLAALDAARQLLLEWVPRMPWVQDWDVELRVATDADRPSHLTTCCASIRRNSYVRQATISLYPNIVDVGGKHWWEDLEHTIVHELVHLLTSPYAEAFTNAAWEGGEMPNLAKNFAQDIEETTVWHVTRALVALKREKRARKRGGTP